MMSLSHLFLCCFILGLCWWVWRCRRYIRVYWKVGSPYIGLPVLGHGYMYMGNREKVLKSLFRVGDHAIANGGLSTTWILHRFYVVLADSVDAEFVLSHHHEKDELMKTIRLLTRTSSTFAPVPIWRPRRKIVTALLSHKNVSKFEPSFSRSSQILVQQLRPLAGKEAFSIYDHFNAYTLDTTCDTILGIDNKSQTDLKEPLRTALNNLQDMAAEALLKLWYHVDFIFHRSSYYQNFLKNDEVIKAYVNEALRKHTEATINDNNAIDEEKQFSLLHLFTLLQSQRGFDHSMLHDESLGLLMASSDTTSISLSIIALILARKPDVQEKIYQELREVFGDSDRPVASEDLPRLRYMEVVIKETQRLYTTVPHVTRTALEDIVLPSGLIVPKGANFMVSIYALHRNPKYWGADADEFRPERFLDGSVPEHNSFFAFGRGPRACPGIQFSSMSTKTVLATLLRQYRLLPAAARDAPLRFLFGITMKDVHDFRVRIQARNTFIK